MKERLDELDFNKLRIFCYAKILSRSKNASHRWKKIFAKDIFDEGLLLNI